MPRLPLTRSAVARVTLAVALTLGVGMGPASVASAAPGQADPTATSTPSGEPDSTEPAPAEPPTDPETDSSITAFDDSRMVDQDTPDLGGVIVVWLLGIVGTAAILGYSWWHSRP